MGHDAEQDGSSLSAAADAIWNFADRLWKVWRWIGLAAIAFAGVDAGLGPVAFAAGLLATGIAFAALSSWITGAMWMGRTEKARKSGRPAEFLFAAACLFVALYMTVNIVVQVMRMALAVSGAT